MNTDHAYTYIHLEERNLTKTRKQKQKYTWEELQSIWHTVASEGFILYNPFVQNTPVEGHGVLHLFHWCNSASSRGLRGVFQSVFFVIRGWFHHRFRKPDLFLCLVISGTCKGKSHGDFKINIYCKQDQPGDAWKSEKRVHIPPISDSIFFMKSERRRLWSCSAIRTALPETANTAMNPTPIPAEPSMFHPFFSSFFPFFFFFLLIWIKDCEMDHHQIQNESWWKYGNRINILREEEERMMKKNEKGRSGSWGFWGAFKEAALTYQECPPILRGRRELTRLGTSNLIYIFFLFFYFIYLFLDL